jgi:hypothetical protein
MNRAIVLAVVALASIAFADGARVAVHPLDARELTVEQREWLRAFFDVRLARTAGVRIAGSNRVEDALRTSRGKDCETKDTCLQYLAESSGSLYAIYARLRREPIGGELLMTARIVRADGTVVKSVSRRAHPERNVELVDTCRTLVSSVVESLQLASLPNEAPALAPTDRFPAPPLLTVEAPRQPTGMSPRRTAGIAIASVGVATLASGVVLFGMAAQDRATLTPDSNGNVPPSQVARASNVAMQGQAGTVLVPVGVIIGLGGALLALWPEDRGVAVSMHASAAGGGVLVGGSLP